MDGESTLRMWQECYTHALSHRRHSLGLTREHKACLLYDGFGGNEAMAPGLTKRRDMWLSENNCTTAMLQARSSASSQPCDASHAYWRRLTDHYEDLVFGFDQDPCKRATIQDSARTCLHMHVRNMESLSRLCEKRGESVTFRSRDCAHAYIPAI